MTVLGLMAATLFSLRSYYAAMDSGDIFAALRLCLGLEVMAAFLIAIYRGV